MEFAHIVLIVLAFALTVKLAYLYFKFQRRHSRHRSHDS